MTTNAQPRQPKGSPIPSPRASVSGDRCTLLDDTMVAGSPASCHLLRGHVEHCRLSMDVVDCSALEAERDEFKRKYHEAMDILTTWGNIDSADAVARMIAAEKSAARLREALREAEAIFASDELRGAEMMAFMHGNRYPDAFVSRCNRAGEERRALIAQPTA